MEIWYLGFGSFRIRTKKGIIITDPYYDKKLNLKISWPKADLVVISQPDSLHNNSQVINGHPFVINAPGEYEIKEINILSIPSYREGGEGNDQSNNTIHLIQADGIKIGHLGQLNHRLSKESLNELNSPDIIFVPLGKENGLMAKDAAEIIRRIGAKIIFPIHYIEESGNTALDKIEPINKFLKEMGSTPKLELKLVINKNDLLIDREKLVILKSRVE